MTDTVIRLRTHLSKFGFRSTLSKISTRLYRRFFRANYILIYFDLQTWNSEEAILGKGFSVSRYRKGDVVPEFFRQRVGAEYPIELVDRDTQRRFAKGADLWCLFLDSEFIGYVWSLKGKTMTEYFFPLTANDVQFVDNVIFSAYRGRRLSSILTKYVMATLKSEGCQRVYGEVAEWNESQLKVVDRMGFRRLGCASKRLTHGHKTVVTWLSTAKT